jgi:hypothetical protein
VTPAASWSPADYYLASRAARRAWERTDSQLTLGLGETDAGTAGQVASVSPSPPSPTAAGTARTAMPPHSGKAGSTPTTTETTANHPQEARGRLQEGA